MTIIFGIFLVLNGLVHLLYAGHSWQLFELRPGLLWPDGSWIFSKLLGDGATRILASISLAIAGVAFAGGGFRVDFPLPLVATGSDRCGCVLCTDLYAFMEWKI